MRKQIASSSSVANMRWLLPLLVGFISVLTGAQASPKPDSRFEPARLAIREVMAEKKVASVSVAVAKDGKIIWEEAFGWADREKLIRATPDTLYSLASISKPFTATGLIRLVAQGKIDLDKPANDHLGSSKLTGLAADASAATVRRVMSDTAG